MTDYIKTRLIPLSKWNEYHDYPTVSALKNLNFHKDRNGFNYVIRRIGRKIYLDEAAFFEWVLEQTKNPTPITHKIKRKKGEKK